MPTRSATSGLADIPAAILAGGFATRLRTVVADQPKVLADVAGRPFLAYVFDWLADAGVRRAVLCTGYLGDLVRERFGDAYGPLALRYSREPAPLGTGGALRHALAHVDAGLLLALNGDSFCEADLAKMLRLHCAHGARATVLVRRVGDAARYGQVDWQPDGRVTSFAEKAESGPGWINAGVYLIRRELLAALPEGPLSLEREALPAWADGRLHAVPTRGRFIDIGTPASYARAERFFTRRRPT
jgi:D-glycero-alpha-D-manno-heptose 1-phosphate guanylyltransferase